MKFLTDHDVYAATSNFLKGLGHDVVGAFQLGLASAEDAELLNAAQTQGRVMVTRDRDYGALVFAQGKTNGVIYLRILPSTMKAVHDELARVLTIHSERELNTSFVVIEPGRHRIRKLRS